MLGGPNLTQFLAPSNDIQHVTLKASVSSLVNPSEKNSDQDVPPTSLQDTLPSFMALSAAQNAMQETSVTDTWMRLAADYMAQAVAEQYLVYKSKRPEVLHEAFSWGFDSESMAEEGSDEWLINTMFFGEDEVVTGWDEIRGEHMRAVSLV